MRDKFNTLMLCLLFGLPFGAVGAGAAYVIGKAIHDGVRAQEWVRVKADLQGFGDGNISYHYVLNGQRYHGDRLGTNPIGGTDNVDDWHERVHDHLESAQREGRPITVWVNPDNPSESMFDRQIRWNLMLFAAVFAFGFGGVGVGAFVVAVASLLPKRAVQGLKNSEASGVGTIWVFAFFWNVISFPIALLAIPQMWAEGNWLGFLVLLFPLVGVLLLWGAVKTTWDFFRRGGARVVFDRDELALGEPVAGHFAFGRKVKVGESFRVRLEAMSNPGLKDERTLWSREVQARVTDPGAGPRLTFRIDTPPRLRAPNDDQVFWRLDAIAANRAAEVHYKFPVTIAAAEEEEEEEEVAQAAPAPILSAFRDDMQPAMAGPATEFERMLQGAGVNLPPEAAARFKRMTPQEREQVAKLFALGPKIKVWAIWAVVGFVVLQVVLGIIGMITS